VPLARPLGALIFGHIGDRSGRKRALMASVIMMALPTMLIGLLPTYWQIGIAAPVLLVVLRLFQGLAVGGEFTTSMVLLIEGAQRTRRGFVGSFAPFGAVGGMLVGSAVGAAITGFLPAAAIAGWRWRLAFLFGLVIGAIVLYVRRRLPGSWRARETPQTRLPSSRRTPSRTRGAVCALDLGHARKFLRCRADPSRPFLHGRCPSPR
jgi:MFS transporter, MHS family, proline/betaine transporter